MDASSGRWTFTITAADGSNIDTITHGFLSRPRSIPRASIVVASATPQSATNASRAVFAAAPSASAAKKPKAAASKTSRFHGVTWRKDIKMWRLTINIGGVTKYMAHFYEEDKAARTFDKVVVRNNFDLPLNFPVDVVKQEEASS